MSAYGLHVITKSRLATFCACQRLHHLQYNLGYRSLAPREHADFGTLIHVGLDAWWSAYLPGGDTLLALPAALDAMAKYRAANEIAVDDANAIKADTLMVGYDARWASAMAEWDVIGVEVEFVATISGRRKLRVAGKLDKLVRKRSDGSIWFVEHKTSGADLRAGATYWQRLRMDPQVSIYFGGCRSLGHEPVGCLYDVIDRPDIRPLKATPPEKRKFTKDGRLYANQRAEDETLDEFRGRIGALVAESPDNYFARSEVVRLESELAESAADVEALAVQIRAGAREEIAPRNPNACFLYNRLCEFHDVCSGAASLDDDTRFRRAEKVHEELSAEVAG